MSCSTFCDIFWFGGFPSSIAFHETRWWLVMRPVNQLNIVLNEEYVVSIWTGQEFLVFNKLNTIYLSLFDFFIRNMFLSSILLLHYFSTQFISSDNYKIWQENTKHFTTTSFPLWKEKFKILVCWSNKYLWEYNRNKAHSRKIFQI